MTEKPIQDLLLQRCKKLIREIVPDAKIILYGSRARGNAVSCSDYDLLVLVKRPVNRSFEDGIREKLYPLELETGAVISLLVLNEDDWNTSLYQAMPFSENVRREGIML